MRNAMLLLLLSLSLGVRSELMYIPAASIAGPTASTVSPNERLKSIDLSAFLRMDRKDFESITGRRMTIDQRLRFNSLKRKAGRNPSSYDSRSLVRLAETDNRKMHWASIVAICCGGVAFLTGIAAIPAVVFGAIGLSKSGPNKEYKGRGLALAGMVAGIVDVALWLLAVAAL
jgi:hypothetical protein